MFQPFKSHILLLLKAKSLISYQYRSNMLVLSPLWFDYTTAQATPIVALHTGEAHLQFYIWYSLKEPLSLSLSFFQVTLQGHSLTLLYSVFDFNINKVKCFVLSLVHMAQQGQWPQWGCFLLFLVWKVYIKMLQNIGCDTLFNYQCTYMQLVNFMMRSYKFIISNCL